MAIILQKVVNKKGPPKRAFYYLKIITIIKIET